MLIDFGVMDSFVVLECIELALQKGPFSEIIWFVLDHLFEL